MAGVKNKESKLSVLTFPMHASCLRQAGALRGIGSERGEATKGMLILSKVQNCFYNPERDILITELRLLGD